VLVGDAVQEQVQGAPAQLAEILADRRQRRQEERGLGNIVESHHADIAGNAAAALGQSAEQAERDGLEPLGRLLGWFAVGVDPDIMGIGPAFAIPQALQRAGLELDQIDVIEINEAFAPQVLACVDELHLDTNRLNPNGGAISLGHPLGASGARLAYTALHELRRSKKRYGVVSACIGGGQGIAAVLEAFN